MAPSATERVEPSTDSYIDVDELRTSFALALSAMYKKEVPLYGDLIRIVRTVNEETVASSSDPHMIRIRHGGVASERLDLERHGAIRLGTPYELVTVRRLFALIGLHPVGYYDLSPAGLPMHATSFRPTSVASLKKNPFRVFTTLLRPELLKDADSRELALKLLARRSIFSAELLRLLEAADEQGGRLRKGQAGIFVQEAMKTFGWRQIAAASRDDYLKLKAEHPILADVACFQSAHINHLTPRTLSISTAQERMKIEGMAVKERIEGPPARRCPILLRQTSFLALEEPIRFPTATAETMTKGSHKARFGEIEERGAAVTPKGRRLYEQLLKTSMDRIAQLSEGHTPADEDAVIAQVFEQYPDTWNELRQKGLVYFDFQCVPSARGQTIALDASIDTLVGQGILEATPVTYEDFLPLSAAGIFQSNLQSGSNKGVSLTVKKVCADQEGYETALGAVVTDMDKWYADAQDESLRRCATELNIAADTLLSRV
jgi:uncharacterized glyoxalase superfamily metalloenzyme YdcJ